MLIRFVIGGDGRVLGSNVAESNVAPSTSSCMAAAVRRWQFPAPEGAGIVTVCRTAPVCVSKRVARAPCAPAGKRKMPWLVCSSITVVEQRFSPDVMTDGYEQVYRRVIAEHQSAELAPLIIGDSRRPITV